MDEPALVNTLYNGEVPGILPIIPLVEIVLYPNMVIPIEIKQKELIHQINNVLTGDKLLGLIVSRKKKLEKKDFQESLYHIGTAGYVLKKTDHKDGSIQIIVQGLSRFKILNYMDDYPYLEANIEVFKDRDIFKSSLEPLTIHAKKMYESIVNNSKTIPSELGLMVNSVKKPGILSDIIASTLNITVYEKQKILEIINNEKRMEEILKLLTYQLDAIKVDSRIKSRLKDDLTRKKREHHLRHQLRIILEELGESDELVSEIEEYKNKIETTELTIEAKKETTRELKRLKNINPSSAEYTISTSYIDWVLSLPWNKNTKDSIDLKKASRILEKEHYGLFKVKKRIIEFLAVKKLNPDLKSPVFCFYGPPGTGKTSLGKSIADSLGRAYIRIALGGLKDESEIRGHRRTYVGALPGRIIQEIRKAGSSNPVIVLDEIDKVGGSFKTDPSAALLEVLDPEQNTSFKDNYLNVDFDLSKVLFITTANLLHTIPPALRDRMEVIEITGYTLEEKIKIALKHLIPRKIKEHGLDFKKIRITEGAVKHVVRCYTREGGVRNLEREIASICRGIAAELAENGELEKNISIKIKDLKRYLGNVRYSKDGSIKITIPGVATGLAWTPTGGEILYIESIKMKGSGNLKLTGQLGDVMKESANTALSYMKSNHNILGINDSHFEKYDIHLHIPSGSIPKDGPSAGITILTAFVSLFTDKIIHQRFAMTGEITLRGQVLPVGGVKEKVLAAYRSGIKTLILPIENKKDTDDIPEKIKRKIDIKYVGDMMGYVGAALNYN